MPPTVPGMNVPCLVQTSPLEKKLQPHKPPSPLKLHRPDISENRS
eukprot:CAMPEP_0172800490 /NCGR_PEP_ID=MMETSP1075-20121228/2626_1 /TAXON_ID=2916 /ORGANISM="Ceratium fusus, Strain PA161109" /LENGTH=44 /DNA_ID= /DNA_START= /DNA_END= /DNA_ORIENTATION=